VKKKDFEIAVIGDFVSIRTDDFSCCFDSSGGGVQGANTAQEQALEPLYRELGSIALKIAESRHSTFREIKSYLKKETNPCV
jgi:hypothetical protein